MTTIRAQSTFPRPPGPVARGLRVGLLGGSFNPAHEGHLHVSEVALKKLGLDYVWWLVSPQNPLKAAEGMAEFARRIESARTFAHHHPRIVVTGIEAALGTRYTADTLKALARRFRSLQFVWLMGSDNMVQIPRWRNWPAIFAQAPVAVVTRPGTAIAAQAGPAAQRFRAFRRPADACLVTETPPAWTVLEARRNPASATRLRGARGWSL